MSGLTHIAGLRIDSGPLTRQRCAWCGTVLVDADISMMAFMDGDSPTVPAWPVGAQVWVDGGASVVDQAHTDVLAPDSCARIDPSVTL